MYTVIRIINIMFLTLIDGPELLIKAFTPVKLKYVCQPNTTPLFPEFPVNVLREKINVRGLPGLIFIC